ncbi:MAG: S-methyl-5-thioribose-1-phosphate isomerase [Candidatus Brockarchaeota archaeon]|nr:S-methyl-5-thioribose-1-phosphate isomerase [Candidatus Brockarchaeota archaeon]
MNLDLGRVAKKLDIEADSELGLPVHRKTTLPVTLWYDHGKETLVLLDQNKLPFELTTWKTRDWKEGALKGIKEMTVRGSQAIGVAGAYCVLLAACRLSKESDFMSKLLEAADFIGNARPTAAPLSWAAGECAAAAKKAFEGGAGPSDVVESVRARADQIMAEDLVLNHYLRKEGLKLLKGGDVVMTHCNGGSLSSTLMGHALGILEEAYVDGLDLTVVSKETRPRSQGYRLTVWELNRAGVPVIVVTDNMISISMEKLGIDMVLLGADRIAADGSVANKVGSSDIARIARDHNIPFYYATSYTTISPEIADGNSIPIEERPSDEITEPYRLLAKELKASLKISRSALDEWPPPSRLCEGKPKRGQIRLFNPAFDVTPPNLISGIVTDLGRFLPEQVSALTREKMSLLAKERVSIFLS